jgi:hypothetical protein
MQCQASTGEQRRIISIGAIEILSLLVVFSFLVPKYGILGAGLSVLIAFSASSIPSMIWSGLMFRGILLFQLYVMLQDGQQGTWLV